MSFFTFFQSLGDLQIRRFQIALSLAASCLR